MSLGGIAWSVSSEAISAMDLRAVLMQPMTADSFRIDKPLPYMIDMSDFMNGPMPDFFA